MQQITHVSEYPCSRFANPQYPRLQPAPAAPHQQVAVFLPASSSNFPESSRKCLIFDPLPWVSFALAQCQRDVQPLADDGCQLPPLGAVVSSTVTFKHGPNPLNWFSPMAALTFQVAEFCPKNLWPGLLPTKNPWPDLTSSVWLSFSCSTPKFHQQGISHEFLPIYAHFFTDF